MNILSSNNTIIATTNTTSNSTTTSDITINNDNKVTDKKRKKVSQACEYCRKKRRKCSGERPKCLTCQQNNYICYYNPCPKKRGPQQKRQKKKI